jgi:hypothetical protein
MSWFYCPCPTSQYIFLQFSVLYEGNQLQILQSNAMFVILQYLGCMIINIRLDNQEIDPQSKKGFQHNA